MRCRPGSPRGGRPGASGILRQGASTARKCRPRFPTATDPETPPLQTIYTVATLGRKNGLHFGEVQGHPSFWGDMCRDRVQYVRNFVYADVEGNIGWIAAARTPIRPKHDGLLPVPGSGGFEWSGYLDVRDGPFGPGLAPERTFDEVHRVGRSRDHLHFVGGDNERFRRKRFRIEISSIAKHHDRKRALIRPPRGSRARRRFKALVFMQLFGKAPHYCDAVWPD